MKRVHLWPYVLILFMGVFLILAFEEFIAMVVGFILCLLGTAKLVVHLTVDEHFSL